MISNHLACIFNLSFTTCKLPSICKTAKIVPVHISNGHKHVINYSPVALLNNFPNLFEKASNERMFRKGKSTQTAA